MEQELVGEDGNIFRTEQSIPGLTLNCLVAISGCYKSSTEH